MTRRRRTRAQRIKIFDAHKGICWRCKLPIQVGEKWHIGHIISLSCGGADDDGNVAPEHEHCNLQDAYETTTPLAAKIKRTRARHLGIKKRSGFKGWRLFNGRIRWADND